MQPNPVFCCCSCEFLTVAGVFFFKLNLVSKSILWKDLFTKCPIHVNKMAKKIQTKREL